MRISLPKMIVETQKKIWNRKIQKNTVKILARIS